MGRRVEKMAAVVEVAQVADLPEALPELAALIVGRIGDTSSEEEPRQEAAATEEEAHEQQQQHQQTVLVASPTAGTIVLKHSLKLSEQGTSELPETLLLAARLHHLCNEYLGTADNAGGGGGGGDDDGKSSISATGTSLEERQRQVQSLAAKAAAGGDLPASVELMALLDVINIVNVRVGLAAEEDGERGIERSEQQSTIVESVLDQVHARMRRVVRRVLRKGVMPARAAPNVGELHLQLGSLEQGRPRVAKLCTLLMARIQPNLAQAALGVTYMWLVGLLRHENAIQGCLCEEAWPLATTTTGTTHEQSGGAPPGGGADGQETSSKFWSHALNDDEGGRNTFLHTYTEKMLTWGSWLISQWALFETVSHLDISQFGKESVTLRNENSWSVPTRRALDLIAKHQPLVEMGAGRGVWTQLLLNRGVDIVAYDTLRWQDGFNGNGLYPQGTPLVQSRLDFVKEGAPDSLARDEVVRVMPGDDSQNEGRTRALVLMWPDCSGTGTYGTECLRHYGGDTLVLVGEWNGHTCGSYTDSVPLHGQSFSKEFQDEVEANFEKVETCRLPTWPLVFDVLTIWRRK